MDVFNNFKTKGIRLANLNICHLLQTLDEIKFHLSQKKYPDIIGLCETFLHDDVDQNV